ncbi:MAG: DAK2 domain-containing protein [Clostridia bacterium]|nr:DAK2 domain-containing protein [Clostridia bacterium]
MDAELIMKEVDGEGLKLLLSGGAGMLATNEKKVNDLNVFPVPDGDTGTNMSFTIKGAVKGANGASGSVGDVAKAMAKGSLLGARGNSGVILSQFLKGISVGLQGCETAGVEDFAKAFKLGVEYAYKAVLKPTEGTILTVMREATDAAVLKLREGETISEFFEDFIEEARASVKRTPDLLPVLKKAGVVDSGAVGLICVLEGFYSVSKGENPIMEYKEDDGPSVSLSSFGPDSKLEFGYCTEFILQLMNYKCDIPTFDINVVTDFLETVGDSIVAIKDEDTVKIHVHTMTPSKVIEFCQQFGEFVTFKMENMSVQHSEQSSFEEATVTEEHKEIAVVSVCTGEGLISVFKELGADRIVHGGQTMNPSSEDFLNVFKTLDADNIIVLPNNSNIYLAAKQAADMYKAANVVVVNTKSIAEGYSALTMLDVENGTLESIVEDLEMAAQNVQTVLVTHSVREGEIDGVVFHENDFICLSGKKLLADANNKGDALIKGLDGLGSLDDKEVLTLIYGKDVTDYELDRIVSSINEKYPMLETFVINGGQDVYSFVVALE